MSDPTNLELIRNWETTHIDSFVFDGWLLIFNNIRRVHTRELDLRVLRTIFWKSINKTLRYAVFMFYLNLLVCGKFKKNSNKPLKNLFVSISSDIWNMFTNHSMRCFTSDSLIHNLRACKNVVMPSRYSYYNSSPLSGTHDRQFMLRWLSSLSI